MTTRYAANTEVSVERSRAELDAILARYGATQRMVGSDDIAGQAFVLFSMAGRQVRLEMTLPALDQFLNPSRQEQPHGWGSWTSERRREWAQKRHEQAQRTKWRALVLVTKAKLELVADGMSSVEREFLADIVLPDGRRVEQVLSPALEQAYLTGNMPPLLPAYGGEDA